MIKLAYSDIYFNELTHTYWLGDKPLSGITGILHKYLFPQMYAGVKQSVLDAAAERGSRVHKSVQHLVEGRDCAVDNSLEEVKAFKEWMAVSGVVMAYSEFVVSDNKRFASPIDIIDKDGNLYDIKTTYALNKEYLRWQLSIYRYLLKLQTGHEAAHLYGVHLRGDKCKVVELTPIPEQSVIALLECAARGAEFFVDPCVSMAEQNDEALDRLANIEEYIATIEAEAKAAKAQRDELRAGLLAVMTEKGWTKLDTDRMTVSVKAAYTQERLDSDAIKRDAPEVYAKYKKTINIKESLTIKIKDND